MKRFRFLALALLVVAMWSWVAYADIFYNVVDSANTKYGIISGRDYNLQSGRRTNVKQYGLALSFTDHKDKPWVIVDEHISGSSAPDTIDIYDPYGNWSAPASERTDWGSNLYDLAVADNFLYIVTFDRYEGETQASGQVIRVNLDNGFAPDGVVYKFEPNAQILRRPCAIEVIDGKLYVLTYTYDGEHSADAGMGRSELFEFGRNLKLLRQTTIGGDDDLSARNAQFMTQYGGKLYVGSSGGAQGSENSVGAVWEINPLTMDTKKIVDLKTVLTGSVWDGVNKGVSGISIAKDGTAYLLLGGYDANWSFTARLYVVTVSNLINGSVGTLAPAPTGTGYAWDVVYDEDLETLWLTAGNQIEARSKSGEIKKTFAPIDLGGDAYKIALIGGSTRYITAPTGDSSSGVEITVGVGKIVTDLKVIADVEKIEQKLREAGVLLKAAFEPEKVTNNTTITNALEKMGLNENEAMRLVKNEIVKATDDGNIVSNPEAVLSKMPPAESSKFSKVEGFGPLRTNWDASEVSPDKKAIVSFPIANAFAGFANLLLSDIDIFKLDDDGDVYHFTRAESLDGLKAGHYIITQKDDSTVTIAPTALLKGDELLYIAIEDDSELDYDKTKGKIFDPFNVGARNRVNDDGGGSGSGGGCDTGVGAFALLLAASAALFKSRKK